MFEIITCACYIQVALISRYKNFGLLAENHYSERLSHASMKAIGQIACKTLCLFAGTNTSVHFR